METYLIVILTLLLAAAAGAVGYIGRRSEKRARTAEEQARFGEETLERYRGEIAGKDTEIAVLRERIAQQNSLQVKLQEEIDAERARLLNSFEEERARQNKEFALKFENLANEILERKSRTMGETNRQSIGDMLKPFSESVERFRQRIEEEAKQRFALEAEVKRLAELNVRMSEEANNLTSALKGNSKYQGDWGEMILETLLENSGLIRDKHFKVQHSVRDENGTLLRPDVVMLLPDDKEIVIDSKVSLNDYVAYCSDDDQQARDKHMAAHVASVRKHINELGTKGYSRLVNSPDFVIMFVPNEPAYLLAMQNDGSLLADAYARGVIVISPTNLFAVLKLVDDLWKRDTQSRNALEIARQGGDMYDKFVTFAETFSDIGDAIRKSEKLYEKGMGQLSQGRGNLVVRIEKLRELGVKTSKTLSKKMTEGIGSGQPDTVDDAPETSDEEHYENQDQ